jgi:hypothetical protein
MNKVYKKTIQAFSKLLSTITLIEESNPTLRLSTLKQLNKGTEPQGNTISTPSTSNLLMSSDKIVNKLF